MNFFSAKEFTNNFVNAAETRAKNAPWKIFLLAIFSGMFIGFGAAGSSLAVHTISDVGVARLIAGTVFPVGLMMVILTGAELFTGDCMFVVGTMEKRYSVLQLIKVLVIVYFGNMVGGVALAWALNFCGQLDYTAGFLGAYTIKVAAGKAGLPFGKALVSGILCNILVCGAVFMAGCAKDIAGKLLAVFFPILLFVVCGFEHCVANMYYIPSGIIAKANPTYAAAALESYGVSKTALANLNWGHFFINNLIPVTIGNILGGMLFFAVPLLILYRDNNKNS